MPTRREFLLGAAALPFANLLNFPFSTKMIGHRSRYLTCTVSPYWSRRQDIDALNLRSVSDTLKQWEAKFPNHSMMTVVDDDGSNVKRLRLPGSFHTCIADPENGLVYAPGDATSDGLLLTFDINTLELVQMIHEKEKPWRRFTGHGLLIPGSDHVAFGMWNCHDMGTYGEISIRDTKTLKEVEVYSSGGFSFHEIRFSTDKKYFVCGHYGSYLGAGKYRAVAGNTGKAHWKSHSYSDDSMGPQPVYPATVTMVDVKSGKLFQTSSDQTPGPEGHADSDELYRIYLPRHDVLLVNRPDIASNPHFREGLQTQPDDGEFALKNAGLGVSLTYDPKFREVLTPVRGSLQLEVTNSVDFSKKTIDFSKQLDWPIPELDFLHGVEFHPDGKHYVLSTSDGFIVAERDTHIVNHAMSFRLPLLIHSHLHILPQRA